MSWICPYCNHAATIRDHDQTNRSVQISPDPSIGEVSAGLNTVVCPNSMCKKISMEVVLKKNNVRYSSYSDRHINGELIASWQLLPESMAKPLPDYIPKAISDDYLEACLILHKSPKASATLARRCLQGMIRDFWGIKKRTLAEEINTLEEKEKGLKEILDPIREVGNIGAHMEKDVNFIIDVEPEEAELMIKLLEDLFEDWYITRNNREERNKKLKEIAEGKKKLKFPS